VAVVGVDPKVKIEPPVRRVDMTVSLEYRRESTTLWETISGELQRRYGLDGLAVDSELSRRAEAVSANFRAVVTLRAREIINLRVNQPVIRQLGLAIDLGTTKIAGYLVDLASGTVVAAKGLLNPQLPFGADVMSRLAQAMKDPQTHRRLGRVAVEGIQGLAGVLIQETGAAMSDVEEVIVAANTAMHHLLLGLPVKQLARAPYEPAVSHPIELKGRDLGLHVAPGAYVYVIPPIGGFVGGDHVAMILATRLNQAKSPTLGLDIGTNTEIVLANHGKLTCCSCASGPAFEGVHISVGMRAEQGALASVTLGPQGNVIHHDTIGGGYPLGMCGSGALDAISEMVRLNIVDQNGLLDRSHPRVRVSNREGTPEFVLFPAAESGTGRDLAVSQRDIAQIQLAKAAIEAGIGLVLAKEGVDREQLSEVLVAGAFGSHLNPRSAVSIGMLPNLPLERIRQVGNAAGTGAIHALVSLSERRLAEDLACRARRLELTSCPDFSTAFAHALRFTSEMET
jgi:uncharacterized 2Fe-2S/4Fe-4S cluster protein (DUF4445 family)